MIRARRTTATFTREADGKGAKAGVMTNKQTVESLSPHYSARAGECGLTY
jgi:hypothetical protein